MTFRDYWQHIPDGMKHLADAISVTALLGYFADMLPVVATCLTIVWTGLRIYETATVQAWLARWRK